MKRHISLITAAILVLCWGCSKFEAGTSDLKDSLDRNVSDINSAINIISSTKGYEMLTAGSAAYKCEEGFRDSITLDLISGIYDFKPDFSHYHMFFIPFKLFEKTGDSDKMVVNMPQKLVYYPNYIRDIDPFDTPLENNFTISASDYHFYYSPAEKYDYSLAADFVLDSEDIGNMAVTSAENNESGFSYSSEYDFNNSYKMAVSYLSGDSVVSTFSLMQDNMLLMKEMVKRVNRTPGEREVKYVLTLGNIDIVRQTGIDSIQVYLDGVLQQNAGVEIIDTTYYGASIRHERDILLAFDDGSTAKLGDMIKPAKKALATIVDSLHSMNFASFIINYIAGSIYYYS